MYKLVKEVVVNRFYGEIAVAACHTSGLSARLPTVSDTRPHSQGDAFEA